MFGPFQGHVKCKHKGEPTLEMETRGRDVLPCVLEAKVSNVKTKTLTKG